jgi:Zn-dependent alcohol dehydrogenase
MRGIVWVGKKLKLAEELYVLSPKPGEVKVKVLPAGIYRTELNMIDSGLIGTPVIPGHEAAALTLIGIIRN